MKTSCSPKIYTAPFIVSLAFLLASALLAQAQFTLNPGSDYLNIYFYDGFSTVAGTDPTPVTINGTGTPLSSYSWLTGSTTPGLVPSGSYNSGYMSTVNANAQISYQQASLFIGSNSLGQAAISPVGTSLTLTNTGSGIAEARLDWTASYAYSGANGADLPDLLVLDFSGTLGTYALLAGQETFQVNSGPLYTASIPIGGDWFNPSGYPVGANVNANFWGYDVTSPFNATPSGLGGLATIYNGDTVTVSGFIDIIIDPGSAQIEIEPAPEPSVGVLSLLGLILLPGIRKWKRGQRGAV